MKKILIIEDDPFVASIYGIKYTAAGFETMTGSDGDIGLELLESFKPDLVHLDLMVPKTNGLEIVKHVRRQPALKSLPIVILSNTYQNALVRQAIAAGATECVSKAACTPKAMLEIVHKLLGTSQAATVEIPVSKLLAAPASPPTPVAPVAPIIPVAPVTPSARPDSRSVLEADMDATFYAGIREAFRQRAPQNLVAVRDRAQALLKVEEEAARMALLLELSRAVHSFGGNAAVVGFRELSQMSSALVALLAELSAKPKHLTPSSLRTVADGAGFLGALLEHADDPRRKSVAPATVLVVDDEVISRRAVGVAVAKLEMIPIKVGDPELALELLQENSFSLIVLDVDMLSLNGFELCTELRGLAAHKTTPVVFVTSLDTPEARERGAASGGNDLIRKPFLPIELAVKALIHILKSRLARPVERRARAEGATDRG